MKKYTDSIDERLTGRHKKCVKFCGDLKDKKILNIGCYNGWFERFAIENCCTEVIGIDTSKNNLLNAKSRVRDKNVKFLEVSALDLAQFEANYFDLITMFDVIEHLPENSEIKCLKGISRVLKDKGKLVVSTPNNHFLANILDLAWYVGHRHYSEKQLTHLLKEDFFVEKIERKGGFYELVSMLLLYFFKWVLRLEVPFKDWFENKRAQEYLGGKEGYVTMFITARQYYSVTATLEDK